MRNIFQIGTVRRVVADSQTQRKCRQVLDTQDHPPRGSVNTCLPCAACGAAPCGSYPSRLKNRAEILPRRTALENYLSHGQTVALSGIKRDRLPLRRPQRGTARRSAANGSFRAWRHDVKVQACRASLEPLAGSRSSRTIRGLNHRAIWLGSVNSTSRQIRIPHDRYAGCGSLLKSPLTSHCLCFVGLGGLCKAVSYSLNPIRCL